MRSTLTRGFVVGILAMQVIAFNVVSAQSLGVNFLGRSGGDTTLALTDVAGVVPQANWHNLASDTPGFDGTITNLLDSAGTATAVKFSWETNDSWNSDGGTGTPDEKLMKGIQKNNPDPDNNEADSFMYFRWQNLVPGSTYNVIVYQAHNGTPIARARTTIGGTSYYTEQQVAFGGTWMRSTSTAPGTYQLGNYVQFNSVSPDPSGTIEIEVKKLIEVPQLSDGIGVPGMQLVKLTGTWPEVSDPPVITAEPADVLGVVGDDVTVSLSLNGPWNVEWFKNDISSAFGTSPEYTFLATAADKDAQVYALVSNNGGSVTSQVATVTLDDPLPEQLTQGFLRGEHYGNIAGPDTISLYNDSRYSTRNYDSVFYTIGALTTDTGTDFFGRILDGYVRPPTAGSYHFFIRSDDSSELFINPFPGTEPGSIPSNHYILVPDAREIGCCNPFMEPGEFQTSEAFTLAADYYGISLVYKEDGGGDYVELAWRESTDMTPAANLTPIGPDNVYCMASPAGKRASITTQPQSVTVLQGRTTTFTVAAETLPQANQFAIQWTKDGASIPGATNPTYTTPLITLADDGTVYQARVYTLTGLLLSNAAILTVHLDGTPPSILSAGFFSGGTVLGIQFDEPLDPLTAANPSNYNVDGALVTGAEILTVENDLVALTLSATPIHGDIVEAFVSDTAGNPGSPTQVMDISTLIPSVLQNVTGDPLEPGRGVHLGAGNYFQESGGSDLWNNRDAGHMITTLWTGPFDIRARVQSLEGPDHWTKTGIMVRETADGGSRHTSLVTTRTAGEDIYLHMWRDVANAGSGELPAAQRVSPVTYPNAWIRLVRENTASNLIQSYLSTDGTTWTWYGDYTMPGALLPETLMLGLVSTSHNNGTGMIATSMFGDFSITTPTGNLLPQIDAISSHGSLLHILWSNGGELESAPFSEGPWTGTGDSDGNYSAPLQPGGPKYFRAFKP